MSDFEIDADLIRELANLLDETGLTEIEIGDEDRHIRVARGTVAGAATPTVTITAPASAGAGSAGPNGGGGTAQGSRAAVDSSHPGAVTSPMVGTVYIGPEPGAPPFVQTGEAVTEGQTLFIVEAMKTMNPIRAPRSGTVSQIFVENEAPVEYGEVLLVLQ